MEFIVAVLALTVVVLGAAVLVQVFRLKSPQPQGDLLACLEKQERTLFEIKTRSELGDRGQDLIREELVRASRSLSALQTNLEARKRFEEENREVIRRLESVIAGSYSKGSAGENILRETFKLFPADMIQADFQVNGKVVEFALKLLDGKVLAVDSKWPATSLVMALDDERDEARRQSIVNEIEREVVKKVREASQYIDSAKTVPWAVAAVPDAVFSVCKRAFLDAYKFRVILISYSMAIPYTLTFFSLHLQYSRSVDVENIETHILEIDRHLGQVEQVLENRMAKGSTMIANAYVELGQLLGKMRGSLNHLKALEPAGAEGRPIDPPSGRSAAEAAASEAPEGEPIPVAPAQ